MRDLNTLALLAFVTLGHAAAAAQGQTSPAPAPASPTSLPPCQSEPVSPAPCSPMQGQPIREVGGRLVVTGETVVVTADPDAPAKDSSVATKSDTPLNETPRSVSIVDRRTLDDRLAINVSDAHDYTTGFTAADDRGPAFSRGFRLGFYDLRRDGLRIFTWSIREPVGVERVQYLRGSAAILYGDGSPGGLVNMVLKKPLPAPYREVTVSGGDLGFGRVTADATGPLSANGRWRYRLMGAAEWLGNGIDNRERRLSLLPMVSVDLTDSITLTMDGEIYHQRARNYWHFVPATDETERGDFSAIPWELNTASPDDRWVGWNVSPGARLDARVSDRTSVHVSGRYTRIGGDIDVQGLSGLAADGRTLNRYAYLERSTWQESQFDGFVTTTVPTGSIEHQLVVGAEGGLSTTDTELGVGGAPSLDMYEPVYGPKPSDLTLRPTRYDISRLGFYVQDQIRLTPRVRVVPGIRLSRVGIENHVPATSSGEATSADTAVSPSLGLVVMPASAISLYATTSRGFEPPTPGQYQQDGRVPMSAENSLVEGGIKADLADGGLAVTGSAFRIRRTNVAETDAMGFVRPIGEGRSWGLETEVVGRVAPRLGIQAGYAWTRTEVTKDLAGFGGNELPNAPRHRGNVWLRYRLPGGPLSGTMVALGVTYVSDRFVASNNAITLPAYTRADASAAYEFSGQPLKLSLGVQNLTNVRYVTTGGGRVFYAGPARRVVAQLSTWF